MSNSRLCWFGLVERKPEEEWVKKILTFEVEGKRLRGRLKKTWMEVINNGLRSLNANRVDAQNRICGEGSFMKRTGEPG